MTAASHIAEQINRAVPHIKTGCLRVYGDFFGRPHDSIHTALSARTSLDGNVLIVEFDVGETLEIWNPGSASVSETAFSIATASKVRWQWFYYGRPQTPENVYYIEHARSGNDVSVTTDVDWTPLTFKPSVGQPAMKIL
jgi:hypothetical protein